GVSGNVTANSIRSSSSPIQGISSFSNTAALTGGADEENDAQLRERFKSTVFRGMAGTDHMFLGIALDDESVTQANVIGASKNYRETIEIVSGNAVSSNPASNIKHVYPGSSVLGTDLETGTIFKEGVHYTFDDVSTPPEVDSIDSNNVPDGIYELEYEYVPAASRNDPDNGITNRIDIWVNGLRSTEATENTQFDDSVAFNTTPGDPLNRTNFLRGDELTAPTDGNFFVPFTFTPVVDPAISDQIVIGANTYNYDTDFWLVNDITAKGGSTRSLSGIEIKSVANGGSFEPTDGDNFDINYLFNAVPRDIRLATESWKLITTDVWIHQAFPAYLNLYMAVIFEAGYPQASVQPNIETALSNFISGIG
ncbi:MAG: baseplate J/gp47 family protein, partial [Saprospiraceae bacterium]|nr:baseplate J/gp47 family protein [Saprospiraceae bacterium]